MRQLLIVALALSAVLTGFVDASAQTTPIYRSNFDSGAKPFGFHSWDDRVEDLPQNTRRYYRQQLVPGLSPSGHAALRITALRVGGAGDAGWGGRFNGEATAPPQGAVRYARWRIRYISPINWRSDSCATPPNCGSNVRTTPDKLFILGNTCENSPYQPTRIIYWQYADYPNRANPLANFSQNIGPSAGGFMPLGVDTWLNVQVEIRSSSSTTAGDGQLKVWVNRNDYSNPNQDSGRSIPIKTAGWGRNTCSSSHIVFGDGSYNPLSTDGATNAVQEIADFEYDDQFDPQWAIGAAGMPSRPSNFRVTPGPMALSLLPAGMIGLVLMRRQKRG
jgi:hypothetical protein